jgi:putative heme-binding domain-containing protein
MLQERGLSQAGKEQLETLLAGGPTAPIRLRALWTLQATGTLTEEACRRLLADENEFIRSWAIQFAVEDRTVSAAALEDFVKLARDDASPIVRLYLASALQRLPIEQRWALTAALLQHGEDATDHNLPLMYWYGVEPLVARDPARALGLAASSRIPQLARFIVRRTAAENRSLDQVVAALAAENDPQARSMMVSEVLKAFEGRARIPMPPSWEKAYERLSQSDQPEIRDQADQIAVILGDRRIFSKLRQRLADASASPSQRKQALDILVRGGDSQAGPVLRQVLAETSLRGPAIRALAGYDEPETARALLELYPWLSDAEKRDVISTLVARASFATALLDAMQQRQVPRTDVHAYHVRQLASLGNEALTRRIQQEWGEIRETGKDKQAQIASVRALLRPAQLARAELSNGRRLFNKNCANCHVLFGEGTKVGPDITGSNRANLDYILENIVDPSAVLGKDYRMTVLSCSDGRVISGLVEKETDSALTVRTINETVVVPKADIEAQRLSDLSLMPERLLDSLQPNEIRDLIAYLASPTQVPLRGPRSPIDPSTRRVPNSMEGESLKVLSCSDGAARSQKMGAFAADAWSGVDQLWWTGGKPGSRLELAVPVGETGRYLLEVVLTKARDYGIVQLTLDGAKLGEPIDLFNTPDVITTGVLEFSGLDLQAGEHKLGIEIVGANPGAVKSYMLGLDYIRLTSK